MPKFSTSLRTQIHGKFGGKCAYCGEEIELKAMQVDHVIPQSDLEYNYQAGQFKYIDQIPEFLRHLGPHDLNHSDNLFPACRVCNNWKLWHSLRKFRSEIEAQLVRMQRDVAPYRMAKRYGLIKETPKPVVFWYEKYDPGYCLQCKGPCRRQGMRFPGEEEDDE